MRFRMELLNLCRTLNIQGNLVDEAHRLAFFDELLEKDYPEAADDLRARWNSFRYGDAAIGADGKPIKVGEEVGE